MIARADTVRLGLGADRTATVRAARRLTGSLLVAFGFLVMYSLAWDSTWHGTVGRDKGFLSPPHAMMYGSAAIAGIIAIAAVLVETVRFYARAGVDDGNAVRAFRVFHAPLGVLVAGFGILTMVVAGPLDNYWHALYGVFISAWHPFHMMGIIGGAIWGLGNLYLWGALAVSSGRDGHPSSVDVLGILASSAVLLRLMMIISHPPLTVFRTIALGDFKLMPYPGVLALTTLWVLWAVQRAVPRRHAGAIAVLALIGFHAVIQFTVPWVVRTQAAMEGRTFLHATLVPLLSLDRLMPDVGLLIVALFVGECIGRFRPAAAGVVAGLCYWVVGALTVAATGGALSRVVLPAGVSLPPAPTLVDALTALPVTVIAASVSATLGQGLGEILRRNTR